MRVWGGPSPSGWRMPSGRAAMCLSCGMLWTRRRAGPMATAWSGPLNLGGLWSAAATSRRRARLAGPLSQVGPRYANLCQCRDVHTEETLCQSTSRKPRTHLAVGGRRHPEDARPVRAAPRAPQASEVHQDAGGGGAADQAADSGRAAVLERSGVFEVDPGPDGRDPRGSHPGRAAVGHGAVARAKHGGLRWLEEAA